MFKGSGTQDNYGSGSDLFYISSDYETYSAVSSTASNDVIGTYEAVPPTSLDFMKTGPDYNFGFNFTTT